MDGSGGSDFTSVDEVRSLKRRCGKIRNRERDLNNRLRKFREGNSRSDARTVACKGVCDQLQVRKGETQRAKQPDAETTARKEVRDQLQVRKGETQRAKQPDAETCGQGQLREGATQRGMSLPAPESSGNTNRNQTYKTLDLPRTKQKRGRRSRLVRGGAPLALNIRPRPSEPQPGPSGLGAAKRVRPDDTASPGTLQGDSKRAKVRPAQGEQRSYARATKDIPARLAVAICLSPPSRDMTIDEAEHIKLSLEDLVMDADPSMPLPAFRGYPRVADGTVQMWCEDYGALTWLTLNLTKIKLPNTKDTLTLVKQSDVPTRVRAALFVPRYNGDIARLQSVLSRQNTWYDIGRWSLYRATSVGGDNHGTYLTLGIPPDEVVKVLERERRISYLLGSI